MSDHRAYRGSRDCPWRTWGRGGPGTDSGPCNIVEPDRTALYGRGDAIGALPWREGVESVAGLIHGYERLRTGGEFGRGEPSEFGFVQTEIAYLDRPIVELLHES
jgi:hypothetical protein